MSLLKLLHGRYYYYTHFAAAALPRDLVREANAQAAPKNLMNKKLPQINFHEAL